MRLRAMLRAAAVPLAAGVIAGCAAGIHPLLPDRRPAPLSGCGTGMTVGADLYVNDGYTVSTASRLGTRDLAWIKGTLGLCAVQIDWNLNSQGNEVSANASTPSPAVIGALASMARHDGLSVSYRVMFTVPAPPGHTGRIAPSDPAAWFASLLAAEKPYLARAQRYGVTGFIAGNEQTTIEANPRWAWFYAQAARIYRGDLSYATWGGRPGYAGVADGDLAQLPPVRDYGITAYPLVNLPASAPQAEVTAAWESYLRNIPAAALSRMALDEVGIPAAEGAYRRPWDWTAFTGRADDEVQARWFTAACTAARNAGMRGIWFFAVFLDDDPAHPYPGLAKFEARPASVAAIRACATSNDPVVKEYR